ncbi:MAG TPA: HAMP domain-containing sensor histidine kinase [Polyangiaceae bacterium]
MSRVPPPESPQALRTLLTARWALLAALVFITTGHTWAPHLLGRQLLAPWMALGLVALAAISNALVTRRGWGWSPRAAGIHLLLDVCGLSVFFAISGAAANPFTMLYFVPIGLATLLPRGFTWGVAGAALVGFGVLLCITAITTELSGHFLHHLVGMWVGLAVSGATITLFVHRLAAAITRQQAELERAREAATQARHLAALGGLAAGAAHELGTPLGTIQLLTDELDALSGAERAAAIDCIRAELSRCKDIIHGMATPELSARQLEGLEPWPLSACRELAHGTSAQVRVQYSGPDDASTNQPELVIRRVLKELVRNAVDACDGAGRQAEIDVAVEAQAGAARIVVRDNGPGLTDAVRHGLFEAYFSTKEAGRGLGLYLARAHLRQLGGDLELAGPAPSGACFIVSFPLQAPVFASPKVAAE